MLPSYPPGLPGILTQAITAHDPDVCNYFTPQGAAEFAATMGVKECAEAITALADQVTDSTAYSNPDGETVTSTAADTTEVHACSLTWNRFGQGDVTAGPQLGHFTLTRPDASAPGYLIDGVRSC